MRKWLLTTAMALFVTGGLAGGAIGIRNLNNLSHPRPGGIDIAATNPVVPQDPSTTTELAPHPAMRDFDKSPPPFEAAGQSDAVVVTPTARPAASSGHLNILLMGIDQRPDETVSGGYPG